MEIEIGERAFVLATMTIEKDRTNPPYVDGLREQFVAGSCCCHAGRALVPSRRSRARTDARWRRDRRRDRGGENRPRERSIAGRMACSAVALSEPGPAPLRRRGATHEQTFMLARSGRVLMWPTRAVDGGRLLRVAPAARAVHNSPRRPGVSTIANDKR